MNNSTPAVKRPMGRPPKPEGTRKTPMNLTFTPEQRQSLLQLAEERQTTVSEMLRGIVDDWLKRGSPVL